MGKYVKISIVILVFAIAAALLIPMSDLDSALLGVYSLIIILPIGIIASIVSIVKEKTKLSVIVLSMFILIPVSFYVFDAVETSIHDYTRNKKYAMTDSELFDAYHKISGKRPLCVLDGGSSAKYLLDIARIDCDTIGDRDILLQYECSEIRARYFQLKGWDREKVHNSRDVIVIHYIHCEDGSYKARYYNRYKYLYYCKNGESEFYNKSDDVNNEWRDYGYVRPGRFDFGKVLDYYENHKSEIPVIAEDEIKKNRTHVRFTKFNDVYVLKFRRFGRYEDLTIIAEHLRERYGATIFDISEDKQEWSASVRIGDSVMKLYSTSYSEGMLRGSLSDMSVLEEIADYFDAYIAEKGQADSTSRLLPEPDLDVVADTLADADLLCDSTAFADMNEHRMDGFWLLEKTDVYGVGPENTELAGFFKRFDDIAFEIRRNMLYCNDGCASYGEPRKVSLEKYFYKVLLSEDTDALKARFKREFDVDLPDNLTIWKLPLCESLYADLLLLPEKVFLIDDGLFYGAYKKVGVKEYLSATGLDLCPEGCQYTIEMGNVTQYAFYDMTFEQAYKEDLLIRYDNEAKHLRKELPLVDVEYSSNVDNEDVYVRYTYYGVKDLVIEMLYDGGVTTFEITEYDDICLVYATYSE